MSLGEAAAGGASSTPGRRLRLLPWAPLLTILAMLAPVAFGLGGTLLPALGWLPALGGHGIGLDAFRDLVAWPGFPRAATLSLTTGFAATAVSLALVCLVCAGWQGTRAFTFVQRALSPLLSVPHAAAAFGIAFLVAPSGWIARALSPWLTGWERPPDLLIVQDPYGLAMIAGLVAKEVPFLLLMTLSALGQVRSGQSVMVAQALGHRRTTAWLKIVLPQVYVQIRLPVYAVLAYSMSVVDVAIILGPNTPPTLSVQVVRWMSDPDLAFRFQAAAGAVAQLALVVAGLAVWRLLEFAAARAGRRWIERGGRGCGDAALRAAGLAAAILVSLAIGLGIAGLAVWSVAGFWTFPNLLPDSLTWRGWARHGPEILSAASETVIIAGAATSIALFLTLASLEAEHRHGLRPTRRALWLLYIPLIVPQVAFLTGLQTLALSTGLAGGRVAVILAHLVFVLPYVFLSLSAPWRAWDARHATVARALGSGPDRVLWRVRLPMLLRPILVAAAVGFAVSVGQYLPTLLVGAGRVETLTTEAVALAAGGDRRIIGAYALAQTAAAFLPFAVAILLPRLLWRNRKGLGHV
ncbi:ABC transporter permease [Lutibaculum baratangense]|uniref:ABC transporter, permease protein YnjC n=1 Tax=Lutibaculum baratangense AMV1 TaxID=631454 RepID=V4RH38_9HYPH|nr:ABC transporter permease subunit [Lutibaculum baratangense]ESR22605.1 ABC transporter, permease protein YnjC [Lutibaculum baratangense AMV1]